MKIKNKIKGDLERVSELFPEIKEENEFLIKRL